MRDGDGDGDRNGRRGPSTKTVRTTPSADQSTYLAAEALEVIGAAQGTDELAVELLSALSADPAFARALPRSTVSRALLLLRHGASFVRLQV